MQIEIIFIKKFESLVTINSIPCSSMWILLKNQAILNYIEQSLSENMGDLIESLKRASSMNLTSIIQLLIGLSAMIHPPQNDNQLSKCQII